MNKSACAAGGCVGTITPTPYPHQPWIKRRRGKTIHKDVMQNTSMWKKSTCPWGEAVFEKLIRPTTKQNDVVINQWRSLQPSRRLPLGRGRALPGRGRALPGTGRPWSESCRKKTPGGRRRRMRHSSLPWTGSSAFVWSLWGAQTCRQPGEEESMVVSIVSSPGTGSLTSNRSSS